MKTELAHWKGATVIRILASIATNHRPDHVAQLVEKEKPTKQQHTGLQLFPVCNKKETADLFGEFFTNLIDARTSAKKGSESEVFSLFETRYGTKRGHAEAFPKGEGDRVKKKGKVPEGRH